MTSTAIGAKQATAAGRTLVAGVGNIFLGDDGFGVEVVSRLRDRTLPPDVEVIDFGIRGLHLAYHLLDGGFERAILVDAVQQGGDAGTVYLIEPRLDAASLAESAPGAPRLVDAHGMTPEAVFRMLASLGGRRPNQVLVVGCEPATLEDGIGLSDRVERGVDEAIRLILELLPARGVDAEV